MLSQNYNGESIEITKGKFKGESGIFIDQVTIDEYLGLVSKVELVDLNRTIHITQDALEFYDEYLQEKWLQENAQKLFEDQIKEREYIC